MCNMHCDNCGYKVSQPPDESGHCYMFEHEPDGDCYQFRLSKKAKKAMQADLASLDS
jgi:quinol monooxygenase YgiN